MGRDLGGSDQRDASLSSPFFWWGVGPGNFGGPYLKYKLPESSEEILDPHNMFIEVWATAGVLGIARPCGRAGIGALEFAWPWRTPEQGADAGPIESIVASRLAANSGSA